MPQTTKAARLAFIQSLAKRSQAGFDWFRQVQASAADFADIPQGEWSQADLTGTAFEGLDLADLGGAIAGIVQIGQILDANDGALRKTFKRVAQFAK